MGTRQKGSDPFDIRVQVAGLADVHRAFRWTSFFMVKFAAAIAITHARTILCLYLMPFILVLMAWTMICSACSCYACAEVLLHGMRSLMFLVSRPRSELHLEKHSRRDFDALSMIIHHTNIIEAICAVSSVNLRRPLWNSGWGFGVVFVRCNFEECEAQTLTQWSISTKTMLPHAMGQLMLCL